MRYLRVFVFILLTGLFVSPFFIVPRIIKIEKVDCTSQYGPCGTELISSLKAVSGKDLESAKAEARRILAKDLTVEKYFLQYKFPDTLKVNVIVRKPKFALKKEEELVVVDEAGVVLGKEKESTLPTLKTDESIPKVGEKVNRETLFASNILYGMFYLFGAKEGTMAVDSLNINIPNGPQVIFPLEGDEKALLGAANLIISRLNKGGEDLKIGSVKIVDLRFKNPILR